MTAASIDSSFRAPEFEPAPLLANAHVQSLWPFVFRRVPKLPVITEHWPLSDGETLTVRLLEQHDPRPGVLIVHGLESSSSAQYVVGLLARIHAAGWNGAAFDFRSCGAGARPTRVAYHAGKTDDLAFVARRLRARWPDGPLGAVGFSLGGNLLLKSLGELSDDSPLDAGVAVSVPFDLERCNAALDGPGFWSRLYRLGFLPSMRRKAVAMAKAFPGRIDARTAASLRTFADFDTHVTAPLFGFADAADYWARASAVRFLNGIRRSTLIICAEDDPLVPPQTIPLREIAQNDHLALWLTKRGGHLGFVGGTLRRPVYAAEDAVMAFLAARLGS